ncbi:MAG: hypothetical protein ABI376_10590 [Caulobacteraceae bacterium]
MNTRLLIAGVAIAALAAGAASARTHHHTTRHTMRGPNYAAPSQPIPYGQLDAYVGGHGNGMAMSSSPGTAVAGSSSDTSATTAGPMNNDTSGSMSSGSMSSGSTTPGAAAPTPPSPSSGASSPPDTMAPNSATPPVNSTTTTPH